MKNLLLRYLLKFKIKIIDVSLEFLIEVSTQKTKFNLYNDQIYMANLKRFSNQSSHSTSDLSFSKSSLPLLSLFVCIKHLFVRSVLFQSYLLGNLGMQSTFEETQRVVENSRHPEITRALGGNLGTWALGHSESTRTLRALRNLGHSRHLSTRGTLFRRLQLKLRYILFSIL